MGILKLKVSQYKFRVQILECGKTADTLIIYSKTWQSEIITGLISQQTAGKTPGPLMTLMKALFYSWVTVSHVREPACITQGKLKLLNEIQQHQIRQFINSTKIKTNTKFLYFLATTKSKTESRVYSWVTVLWCCTPISWEGGRCCSDTLMYVSKWKHACNRRARTVA